MNLNKLAYLWKGSTNTISMMLVVLMLPDPFGGMGGAEDSTSSW